MMRDNLKDNFNNLKTFVSNILNNEKEILKFKVLQKPKDFQMLITLIKYFLLKVIIISKNKWLKIVKNSLDENEKLGKKRLINIFFIGLFNFFASTPINIIIVLPLTFGSLFYILENQKQQNLKSKIATIFAFLFGHFVSLFWWFFIPLTTDFLHLFWLTPFAILGLPCLMACLFIPFIALFSLVFDRFLLQNNNKIINKTLDIFNIKTSNLKDIKLLLIFTLSWLCGDFVRGHIIFGGFPWMMLGHFVNYSFAFQSVRLLGIDLYSIFFLLLVLVPYFLIFKKKNILLQKISYLILIAWAINCTLGLLIVMVNLVNLNNKINANIVGSQINHEASLNLERDYIDILNKNVKLISWISHSNKDTILLFPESSINKTLENGSNIAKNLGYFIPNEKSILLGGGIYIEEIKEIKNENSFFEDKYKAYNVIYAINKDGNITDLYKKQKLVPFGEYLPFRSIIPQELINMVGGMIDFSKDGENDLFVFYRDLPIIYPTICYESIFPSYVKHNIKKSRKKILEMDDKYLKESEIKNIKERGEIIVNLTNDIWMGHSTGAYQHFLMARFLAVYTGLPVVRVSNNGISAYIDKTGVVRTKTKLNKEDILYVNNI